MIDFGLCWDPKVRSHRCTNDFVHLDSFYKRTPKQQEILLRNSEAGKKKLGPIVGS